MKRSLSLAFAVLAMSICMQAAPAFADIQPTLGLLATGNSDNVQISVTGDPNESVLLSYDETSIGPVIQSLGTTDGSGSFTTTISSASYQITSGTLVTALVGGTSGLRSEEVAWPMVTSSDTLTLSQGALVLSAGSSAAVTATNMGSTALYVSSNSNPSIANVSISGNAVTVTGNVAGSTTVTLCPIGAASNCPSVYVMVEPAGAVQLSFSQSNPTIVAGQNLPITITGGSGIYMLLNNSNSGVIGASLSGSVLTLSTGASTGSASITVCTTDESECGAVTATAGSASNVAVALSTNAPVLSVNQSTSVYIYGPSGVSFYVSGNSNPSVVQANLSGTTLTLTGIAQGSSNISVCASTGSCSSLSATVNAASTGANITLSQSSLSLQSGQNASVTVSGGTQPYTISGGTSAVSQETLSGNTLTVYGIAGGTSSVWICSSAGGCTNLAVAVNGPAVAVTVSPAPVVTTTVAPAPAAIATAPAYIFTESLAPGSQDAEVLQLQEFLAAQGYLSATPNGYFGPATQAAVMQFQAAHDIEQLGIVGPATRAALNAAQSDTPVSADVDISTMTLAQLQAQVQSLQAQLTQAIDRITQLTGQ